MNAIDFNIATATTAELVVFYNAHSNRPAIKKFSDRATAVARCAAIQDAMKAALAEQTKEEPIMTEQNVAVENDIEEVASTEVAEQDTNKAPTKAELAKAAKEALDAGKCPACGHDHLSPNGEEGTIAGDEQLVCDSCGAVFWKENGKQVVSKAETATKIAAAVAQTWNDPAVKAKRMERHNIYVTDVTNGEGGPEVFYKSVLDAFKALGLMISRHIKFRAECKAAGEAGKVYEETKADGTVVKFLFRAVEQVKPEPKAKAAPAEGGKKRGRKSKAEKAAAAEEAAVAQAVESPEDVEVEEV